MCAGESVRGCAAFRFYFKLWRKELVYLQSGVGLQMEP